MKVYKIEDYKCLDDYFIKNQDQNTYDNIREWNENWKCIDIDLYTSTMYSLTIKNPINNKIPESYIHEIQVCFYHNYLLLEITL